MLFKFVKISIVQLRKKKMLIFSSQVSKKSFFLKILRLLCKFHCQIHFIIIDNNNSDEIVLKKFGNNENIFLFAEKNIFDFLKMLFLLSITIA